MTFRNSIYANDTQEIYVTEKGYYVWFNTDGLEEDIFLGQNKSDAIKTLNTYDADGFLAKQLEKSNL